MAAMSRLMASLDPDQRAQLAQMAEQLLGDMDLSFQADQLQRALQGQFPELGWGEGMGGAMPSGRQSRSLSETLDWVEHLQGTRTSPRPWASSTPGRGWRTSTRTRCAARWARTPSATCAELRDIEQALEQAGAARHRRAAGLTPRGVRAIGERSLAKIYERAVGGQVGSTGPAGPAATAS